MKAPKCPNCKKWINQIDDDIVKLLTIFGAFLLWKIVELTYEHWYSFPIFVIGFMFLYIFLSIVIENRKKCGEVREVEE